MHGGRGKGAKGGQGPSKQSVVTVREKDVEQGASKGAGKGGAKGAQQEKRDAKVTVSVASNAAPAKGGKGKGAAPVPQAKTAVSVPAPVPPKASVQTPAKGQKGGKGGAAPQRGSRDTHDAAPSYSNGKGGKGYGSEREAEQRERERREQRELEKEQRERERLQQERVEREKKEKEKEREREREREAKESEKRKREQRKKEEDEKRKAREAEEKQRQADERKKAEEDRERQQQERQRRRADQRLNEISSRKEWNGANGRSRKLGMRADDAAIHSNKTFANDLRVSRTVSDSLHNEGIANPLPLQDKCIPHGLREYDVYAMAGPGTGRTLTWVILAVDRLSKSTDTSRVHCLEPAVLVLVAGNAEAEACADILQRLKAPASAAVLESSPLNPGACGSEIAVMTPVVAAALIQDCTMSLRRTHILVIDSCTDMEDADAKRVQLVMTTIKGFEKRGSDGYQTIAFSETMNSPVDHVVYSNIRIDRVDFQSVKKPLPHRIGTHFTFLQLANPGEKEEVLDQLCKVPAMDKIVIVAQSLDVQSVQDVLTNLRLDNTTVVVWDTPSSRAQQVNVCKALRDDMNTVVLMDMRCYQAFDKEPETNDVAMYILYDPMVASRVFEDRRQTWKRTCRVFMTTLLSTDTLEVRHTRAFIAEHGMDYEIIPVRPKVSPIDRILLLDKPETSAHLQETQAHEAKQDQRAREPRQQQERQQQHQQQPQTQTQTQPQAQPQPTRQDAYPAARESHQPQTQHRAPPSRYADPNARHGGGYGAHSSNRWDDQPEWANQQVGHRQQHQQQAQHTTHHYGNHGKIVEDAIVQAQVDDAAAAALHRLPREEAEEIIHELGNSLYQSSNPSKLVVISIQRRFRPLQKHQLQRRRPPTE